MNPSARGHLLGNVGLCGALIALCCSVVVIEPSGAIVNGGTEVTQSASWPWTVGIEIDSNGALEATCSGVMIGPTTVLTAAHCVDPGELGFTPTAGDLFVTSDRDLATAPPADLTAVTSFVENPAFNINDFEAGHDESVLQLAAQPEGTSPLPLLQPADVGPFSSNFSGLVAGYGQTVPGNRNSSGLLYQTQVSGASYGSGVIAASSSPAYTCFGDSGGPLIVDLAGGEVASDPTATNGSWAIIGLTSFGDSTCASADGFTNAVNDYGFIASQSPYLASEPFNSAAPQVIGSALVGATLTCDPGTWSNNPSFSYQWLTTGAYAATISGATAPSYTPMASSVGSSIACAVTATASGETVVADSAAVTIAATTPSAPTDVTATAGKDKAMLSFAPPASSGGAAITSYLVQAAPSGRSATGTSSPVVLTGLTAGATYSFTVAASNALGTGAASERSNAVTIPADAVSLHGALTLNPPGKSVLVGIRCGSGACQGSAQLTDRVVDRTRRGARWVTTTKIVVLASGAFSLKQRTAGTMRLTLTAAGRRTLGLAKGHTVTVQLRQRPTAAPAVIRSVRIYSPT